MPGNGHLLPLILYCRGHRFLPVFACIILMAIGACILQNNSFTESPTHAGYSSKVQSYLLNLLKSVNAQDLKALLFQTNDSKNALKEITNKAKVKSIPSPMGINQKKTTASVTGSSQKQPDKKHGSADLKKPPLLKTSKSPPTMPERTSTSKPQTTTTKPMKFWRDTSIPLYGPEEGKWFDGYEAMCRNYTREQEKKEKKLCPCLPPKLRGHFNVTFESPSHNAIAKLHPDLQRGGKWQPRDCVARQRNAIVVPFRDREVHLRIFLNHLILILKEQKVAFQFFIIEQEGKGLFNRATLMNIGYVEAKKSGHFDCYTFHDVDLLVEDSRHLYTCMDGVPRHLSGHVDTLGYGGDFFGGGTIYTGEQVSRTNGFANDFYGWGGEDDDARQRIKRVYKDRVRYPHWLSRYKMIRHNRTTPYNPRRGVAYSWRPDEYVKNGLNSLKYKVKKMELKPTYTWLLVSIPEGKF